MDYRVSGVSLESVADAIRTKGGTSADLSFPDGFVTAIGNIQTGGGSTLITKSITANGTYNASDDDADGYSSVSVNVAGWKHESGTFTCPDSGATGTLNFANTYSKYMIIVEATDDTKTAIMNSGQTSARTYGFIGYYPKSNVGNYTLDTNTTLFKIVPTTGVISAGSVGSFTYSGTSVVYPLSTMQYANYLYQGYSYKYNIVEIE